MQFDTYQVLMDGWMQRAFGPVIAHDKIERNYRFLEEALELTQANGCTKEDALKLVDYVFARPAGEPHQEVGGVMVTLAALCTPCGIDLNTAAVSELDRISQPEVMEKIRNKQKTKPMRHGPLPGATS